MLDQNKNLKADIWIRGQHSQAGSTDWKFLEKVSPKAIITTEANFPAHERLDPKWVEMLAEKEIRILSLKQTGLIQLNISERTLDIHPYLEVNDINLKK